MQAAKADFLARAPSRSGCSAGWRSCSWSCSAHPTWPPTPPRSRFLIGGQPQGDGSKVEQAMLGLTALGNVCIELYANCTGSLVDSVIRDAAVLACDDPLS